MTPAHPLTAVSSSIWLKAFVLVVCFVIVFLEGWRDWSERRDEILQAENLTANIARSLAQHAEDTFELADAVIVDLVDRAASSAWSPARTVRLRDFLVERIKTLPRLKTLAIFGPDGKLRASSVENEPADGDASG